MSAAIQGVVVVQLFGILKHELVSNETERD